MNRTEWPTAGKLEELRAQGVVPFSRATSALIGCFVLLLSLLALKENLAELWRLFPQIFSVGIDRVDHEKLELFWKHLTLAVLIPASALLVAVVLTGLVQTRFMFKLDLVGFNFARLKPFGNVNIILLAWRSALAVLALAASIVIGLTLLYIALTDILTLLNFDKTYFIAWAKIRFDQALPALLLVLAVLAVLSWLFSRFMFMMKYRMSREEVEAEQGED